MIVGVAAGEDEDVVVERVVEDAHAAELAVQEILGPRTPAEDDPLPFIVQPDRRLLRRFAEGWDGVRGAGRSGGYYVEGGRDGERRAHAVVARGEVGVMAHELAHGRVANLGRHAAELAPGDPVPVPPWLDEGIAEQARMAVLPERRARQVFDTAHSLAAALVKVNDPRARLANLLARRSLHPTDRSGYSLSLDFVGWLGRRLGPGGLRRLALRSARAAPSARRDDRSREPSGGNGAARADWLADELRMPQRSAERAWHASLRPVRRGSRN